AELSRITGAQTPSGVPVTITAPPKERGSRGGAFMGRGTKRGGGAPARGRRPGVPTPEARTAAAQRRSNRAA
ncbi:ATP-dependent helicase, partial [Streptomyces pratensis]